MLAHNHTAATTAEQLHVSRLQLSHRAAVQHHHHPSSIPPTPCVAAGATDSTVLDSRRACSADTIILRHMCLLSRHATTSRRVDADSVRSANGFMRGSKQQQSPLQLHHHQRLQRRRQQRSFQSHQLLHRVLPVPVPLQHQLPPRMQLHLLLPHRLQLQFVQHHREVRVRKRKQLRQWKQMQASPLRLVVAAEVDHRTQ